MKVQSAGIFNPTERSQKPSSIIQEDMHFTARLRTCLSSRLTHKHILPCEVEYLRTNTRPLSPVSRGITDWNEEPSAIPVEKALLKYDFSIAISSLSCDKLEVHTSCSSVVGEILPTFTRSP